MVVSWAHVVVDSPLLIDLYHGDSIPITVSPCFKALKSLRTCALYFTSLSTQSTPVGQIATSAHNLMRTQTQIAEPWLSRRYSRRPCLPGRCGLFEVPTIQDSSETHMVRCIIYFILLSHYLLINTCEQYPQITSPGRTGSISHGSGSDPGIRLLIKVSVILCHELPTGAPVTCSIIWSSYLFTHFCLIHSLRLNYSVDLMYIWY